MPVPRTVISDEILPAKVDVVIIGAGIAGISTALELSERGLSVAVCEKGIVAGEQSSRNWGWCRQMGRDPRELPLMQVSIRLWRQMHQRTGEDVGFRECGIAYLCETARSMAKRRAWFQGHADGLTTRFLDEKEANAMTYGSSIRWKGGLYTQDDGRAEPTLAVPVMAACARRTGAKIFQKCAVRGIERRAGRVSGVVTEKGRIAADSVVLAGGAWSRRFCMNMGLRLPQLSVINSVMRTAPFEAHLPHSLAGEEFAIRKRLDGGYTVANAIYNTADIVPDSFALLSDFWELAKGDSRDLKFRLGREFITQAMIKKRWKMDEISPFEMMRVLDPKPVPGIQNRALRSLRRALPQFENVPIDEEWAGAIDVVPDLVPVISEVSFEPGFFMITGFSGHGFGLGPGAGRLMADLVAGDLPCVDPLPFRFERF